MEIDFHFVRDKVANKSLEVCFIPTTDQLADVLTKPIVSVRFQHFCFKLNVRHPPLNLQEDVKAKDKAKDKTLSNSNSLSKY